MSLFQTDRLILLTAIFFSCFLCEKTYVRICQVAALEEGVQGRRSGGGEETETPYGLEELDFLARLQDADPEH